MHEAEHLLVLTCNYTINSVDKIQETLASSRVYKITSLVSNSKITLPLFDRHLFMSVISVHAFMFP